MGTISNRHETFFGVIRCSDFIILVFLLVSTLTVGIGAVEPEPWNQSANIAYENSARSSEGDFESKESVPVTRNVTELERSSEPQTLPTSSVPSTAQYSSTTPASLSISQPTVETTPLLPHKEDDSVPLKIETSTELSPIPVYNGNQPGNNNEEKGDHHANTQVPGNHSWVPISPLIENPAAPGVTKAVGSASQSHHQQEIPNIKIPKGTPHTPASEGGLSTETAGNDRRVIPTLQPYIGSTSEEAATQTSFISNRTLQQSHLDEALSTVATTTTTEPVMKVDNAPTVSTPTPKVKPTKLLPLETSSSHVPSVSTFKTSVMTSPVLPPSGDEVPANKNFSLHDMLSTIPSVPVTKTTVSPSPTDEKNSSTQIVLTSPPPVSEHPYKNISLHDMSSPIATVPETKTTASPSPTVVKNSSTPIVMTSPPPVSEHPGQEPSSIHQFFVDLRSHTLLCVVSLLIILLIASVFFSLILAAFLTIKYLALLIIKGYKRCKRCNVRRKYSSSTSELRDSGSLFPRCQVNLRPYDNSYMTDRDREMY